MKMKFILSSRFHLALGLSSLVVTLLLTALFAGLLPDRDAALRAGRTSLAEAVGVAATALLAAEPAAHDAQAHAEALAEARADALANKQDALPDSEPRLQQVLGFIVGRNPELLSIGLRSADGQLIVQAAATAAPGHVFGLAADAASTETHVRVPLLHEGTTWGHAELHFTPIEGAGVMSLQRGSPALLVALMGAGSFVLFYFYLRRMLRHLDPSRVIPGRVRTAFDTLAEGLLVLDPKGRIVLANTAFMAVVGGDADALVGRDAAQLGWTQPDGAAASDTPWACLETDGRACRNVLLYLHDAQGKRRSFMVNGSPVPGAGGKAAGMLVSLDDVTTLEEQEIQLRLARDEAEAANRAKSDFLANMSHEIRTPMNAILGFTELLRRGWQHDSRDTQRHLDTILGSGHHLLALINDILDLSKVEAGRLEVESIACPVHEVVREVVDIMRLRGDEKGVGLKLEFPGALPATLQTDPARLRQIVTNLIGNALKFTSHGQITVSVRLAPAGEAGEASENTLANASTQRLYIDISDTGIGIPGDKLEAIFEPFVQAEVSTTRQFGGTGLGLAISRRFARALGGDVVATSLAGLGSTFHVSIAVAAMGDDAVWLDPAALQAAARIKATGPALRWVFEPATVLVVDDGAENRELVRLVLESAGLLVIEAENGALALEAVAQHSPALILMDVQMPVMDGYTATRALRDKGCTLPVLALTANAMKGFEQEIQDAGFSGYQTKPVDIDALLAAIAQYLVARQVAMSDPSPQFATPAMPAALPQDDAGAPIRSRLQSHPRLARVVRSFAQVLPQKLHLMQEALAARQLNELAELAHWLKGAGGTVGFDQFFEPAREFEQHALAGRLRELEAGLHKLQSMAARLVVPDEDVAAPALPGAARLT